MGFSLPYGLMFDVHMLFGKTFEHRGERVVD